MPHSRNRIGAKMDLPLKYKWVAVDGKAVDSSAQAETPGGRIKVDRRRPGVHKFVARVRGEAIGRDYSNLDGAKRAAEAAIERWLAASREKA